MDKIKKLLRKIGKKDRQRLLSIINILLSDSRKQLDIIKIKNTDFYRVRSGRFRILFHYEKGTKDIVIDSVKLRDKDTYK